MVVAIFKFWSIGRIGYVGRRILRVCAVGTTARAHICIYKYKENSSELSDHLYKCFNHLMTNSRNNKAAKNMSLK